MSKETKKERTFSVSDLADVLPSTEPRSDDLALT